MTACDPALIIDDLIGREGNYANQPADKGGPTRWGISEQVARAHGYQGDMCELPRDMAVEIYREQFWLTPGLDKVSITEPILAIEMFDAGVNMGAVRAGKFVQRALNLLNRVHSDYPDVLVDGQFGAVSRAALASYRKVRSDQEGLAVLLWLVRAFRSTRYAEIAEAEPSQEAFEYGWIARQVRLAYPVAAGGPRA